MGCLGVHFALTEPQSRRLLSASDEEQVMEIIEEIEGKWDEERLQETDKAWDAIHRCLTGGTLEWVGGAYPLNTCILGGTPLYGGDDYVVSFKTPEQVKEVSEAVSRIAEDEMRRRYSCLTGTDYPQEQIGEEDFDYTWGWFEELKGFYRRAAASGWAVLFTAEQ